MNTTMDHETVRLPEIVWQMGHPTVADPEMRATRLRRCIVCGQRQSFTSPCGRGMIVHLIDPDDVHASPGAFDGVPFAEPQAIEKAHAYWRERGFVIVRKPVGLPVHPRFVPCPVCNEDAMRAGRLPVTLPTPPAPAQGRGGRIRDATRG